MHFIALSIFDIFKVGPGPSSSHTIGPMKAAGEFRTEMLNLAANEDLSTSVLEVFLYGSLSSTGEGHGTHKAVLGGLLGWKPESCDCDALLALLEDREARYQIEVGGYELPFRRESIHFAGTASQFPYQNTLVFKLSRDGKSLLEKEYYSIGGGFIKAAGELEKELTVPPHPYRDMRDFRRILRRDGLSLSEVILQNEEALTGCGRPEIITGVGNIIDAMCDAVDRGLGGVGILPGPIGLPRKAKIIFKNAETRKSEVEKFLARLNACSMAASEENAGGRKVVTAPTSGASGVLPGLIYILLNDCCVSREKVVDGMLAAALIAFIAKHNASIAGAEVGCQGEVGVASAMAAALLAAAWGHDPHIVENAAEIALEHHLGMTCDPVDGYVQVPCIERNAVGAATAFNAYVLASAGDPSRQRVSFDDVVEAMLETGREMSKNFKETAKGGLAVCCVNC